MKKIIMALLSVILISGLGCGNKDDEEKIGHAKYGGVEFRFNFNNKHIEVINRNDTLVFVRIYDFNNFTILFEKLVSEHDHKKKECDTKFKRGETFEIKIWRGYASALYGYIIGQGADFTGQGVFKDGHIKITPMTNVHGWEVKLPQVNGSQCYLSGQYDKNNFSWQYNNSLYCQNESSDLLFVELYLLKPTGNGYETDFELAEFWVYAEDMKRINYAYKTQDALALRVTSYDIDNNNFIDESIFGFWLYVADKEIESINGPITLP